MIRKIAEFYAWGMALSLLITLWIGAAGAETFTVFVMALLSWPLAFFVMIAKRSLAHILADERSRQES